MKILTKPMNSRLPFPSVYGYEEDGESSWVEVGSERIVVWIEGKTWPVCVSITTNYECKAGGYDYCTIGETDSDTNTWGVC